MDHPRSHAAAPAVAWQPVRALSDIDFLVKEAEVVNGHAGRHFVIAGADRLCYRVHSHPPGFIVERLNPRGCVLDRRHLLPWELQAHGLAQALACGQLLTTADPCTEPGMG